MNLKDKLPQGDRVAEKLTSKCSKIKTKWRIILLEGTENARERWSDSSDRYKFLIFICMLIKLALLPPPLPPRYPNVAPSLSLELISLTNFLLSHLFALRLHLNYQTNKRTNNLVFNSPVG